MNRVFPWAGRAVPLDFPGALPSRNPLEQPCQPLENHHCLSDSWFVEIYVWRHHTIMIGDGAFSHKIDYVTFFWEILNLEGYINRIIGSRFVVILLNVWI